MNTEKEMSIDRIENGIAAAFDRNGNKYSLCTKGKDIKENDIIVATVSEQGSIIDLEVLTEKTVSVKRSLSDKLKNLFNS